MNNFQRLSLSSLVLLAAIGAVAGQANAQVSQDQQQDVYSSTSFYHNCQGNGCSGSSEIVTSSEVRQYQSQSTNTNRSYSSSYSSNNNGNTNGTNYRPTNGMMNHRYNNGYMRLNNRNRYGQVELGWDYQGGTCHVRYSEATSQDYRYSTSTNCDEGSMVISGLQYGKNYRFQVKQDDGEWSPPVIMRAR